MGGTASQLLLEICQLPTSPLTLSSHSQQVGSSSQAGPTEAGPTEAQAGQACPIGPAAGCRKGRDRERNSLGKARSKGLEEISVVSEH